MGIDDLLGYTFVRSHLFARERSAAELKRVGTKVRIFFENASFTKNFLYLCLIMNKIINHSFRVVTLTLLVVSVASCGNKQDNTAPSDTSTPDTATTIVYKDNADAKVQARNRADAGFVQDTPHEVTITRMCFGAVTSETLDMLPEPTEATRRDSTLLDQLDHGAVFILQPGTKGIVEVIEETRMLVRFQSGPLWIPKSATL